MSEDLASHMALGSTALWTAAARALESRREDRLFNDPWASALAGSEGAVWAARQAGSPFATVPMVIRTRYFDDFLQGIMGEAALRQVVLPAAGLDTRAFRLPWPDQTRLYELDQPDVLRHKQQVLDASGARPACQRVAVPADLTADWSAALTGCGFDPRLPSVWLLEGLLFYLPNAQILCILDEITRLAAPASWLAFDIVNSATLTSPITRAWVEMQVRAGAPWLGSLDDPEAFLAKRGWQPHMTQPGAPDANYGRWTLPVIPVRAPDLPHNWYVTAQKTAAAS